jgi:hypothetical protein
MPQVGQLPLPSVRMTMPLQGGPPRAALQQMKLLVRGFFWRSLAAEPAWGQCGLVHSTSLKPTYAGEPHLGQSCGNALSPSIPGAAGLRIGFIGIERGFQSRAAFGACGRLR